MKTDYKFHHTLSIGQYNQVIRQAFRRLEFYKRLDDSKWRYYYTLREGALVRHCKIMIRYIQSQLN